MRRRVENTFGGWGLVWLAACAAGCTASDGKGVDTDAPVQCDAGGWDAAVGFGGPAAEAEAVYVAVDGDDAATGELQSPMATVAAAVERARGEGRDVVLVQPGVYETETIVLDGDVGLEVRGCGPEQVTLRSRDGGSVFWVTNTSGTEDRPIVLSGLRVEGGRFAVLVWQSSTALVDRVQVAAASTVGVVFEGGDTVVRAHDLSVLDTVAVDGVGYGAQIREAQVRWEGGEVAGSTGLGVLVHGVGTTTLTDLVVRDTLQAGGALGRGVQVQGGSVEVRLVGVTVERSHDVGVLSLGTADLTLSGLQVREVGAGLVGGVSTGDGVVVGQRGAPDVNGAELFVVRLEQSAVSDTARAGVLAADVVVSSIGTVVTGAGLEVDGGSVFSQGAARVEEGSGPVPHLVDELAQSALVFDAEQVALEVAQ